MSHSSGPAPRKPVAGWLLFWIGFAALDLAADRRGASLCTAVRHIFRTHTPTGRVVLTAALGTGTLILHRHLLKDIASGSGT